LRGGWLAASTSGLGPETRQKDREVRFRFTGWGIYS